MGINQLVREGDTIFRQVDELDTRLYDIEDEYDTDHLEDNPDLKEYIGNSDFRKVSQLANKYIRFLGKIHGHQPIIYDKLSTSSRYIMENDLREYEEADEFEWSRYMHPLNQDTSIHIKVEASLGLIRDILFILKRLKKQKRKHLTKKKQGLNIAKPKGRKGPRGHFEELDSEVLEQISSHLGTIPMNDEVLHRIDGGQFKVKKKKKKKKTKKKKTKKTKMTGTEGIDYKTFKVGQDYPSSCRPRIEKSKRRCKSHNLQKRKRDKACYESRVHILNL